jgi:hypothetical protein
VPYSLISAYTPYQRPLLLRERLVCAAAAVISCGMAADLQTAPHHVWIHDARFQCEQRGSIMAKVPMYQSVLTLASDRLAGAMMRVACHIV